MWESPKLFFYQAFASRSSSNFGYIHLKLWERSGGPSQLAPLGSVVTQCRIIWPG